ALVDHGVAAPVPEAVAAVGVLVSTVALAVIGAAFDRRDRAGMERHHPRAPLGGREEALARRALEREGPAEGGERVEVRLPGGLGAPVARGEQQVVQLLAVARHRPRLLAYARDR